MVTPLQDYKFLNKGWIKHLKPIAKCNKDRTICSACAWAYELKIAFGLITLLDSLSYYFPFPIPKITRYS